MENKAIDKLSEVLMELDLLEKQYRNEYNSAVDIEDLDVAKEVQESAFEKIRRVKSWKTNAADLRQSISDTIGVTKEEISQPNSVLNIETILNDDSESKIGKYVRYKIHDLNKYEFSYWEIKDMSGKRWSKMVLGLDYPFIKKYDCTIPILEQMKDSLGYNRYWNEVFSFGKQQLLVTSQWFERDREKFDNWYTSIIEKSFVSPQYTKSDTSEEAKQFPEISEFGNKPNDADLENNEVGDYSKNIEIRDTNDEPSSKNEEIHTKETDIEEYIFGKIKMLCEYKFSEEEIKDLLSKPWSERVLGLNYPFAKKYGTSTNYLGYGVYGKDVFTFGEHKLHFYRLWKESDRESFNRWYDSLNLDKSQYKETEDVMHSEYSNKSPISINLFDRTYQIKFWNEVLIKVCEVMLLKKPYIAVKFDKEITLNRTGHIKFSYIESEIKEKRHKLSNGLWIETAGNAEDIVKMSIKILKLCGYKEDDLVIEYQ